MQASFFNDQNYTTSKITKTSDSVLFDMSTEAYATMLSYDGAFKNISFTLEFSDAWWQNAEADPSERGCFGFYFTTPLIYSLSGTDKMMPSILYLRDEYQSNPSSTYFIEYFDHYATSVEDTYYSLAKEKNILNVRYALSDDATSLEASYTLNGVEQFSHVYTNESGFEDLKLDGMFFNLYAQGDFATAERIAGVSMKLTDLQASSAIPEPSAYAAVFGGLALFFAVYRRR